MVLRQTKPSVKGTTRVSFNDRQLVRKLYSANKNSRQARQKQSRELSKEDKERLAQAPHRKSHKAFNYWMKKVKQGDFLFDLRDTDDRVAVKAMCLPQWNDIVQRRDRMHQLISVCRKAKQTASNSEAVGALLTNIAINLTEGADLDVPLLTGRKHPRVNNYRKKIKRRSELFGVVPRFKRPGMDFREKPVVDNTEQQATKRRRISEQDKQLYTHQSTRNLCEPIPKCDYEDCDENVFYVCHRCNEPVQATRMIVKSSGAFDAFFFHPDCYQSK